MTIPLVMLIIMMMLVIMLMIILIDDVNNLSVVGVDIDDLHSHEFLHPSIFILFLYYPVS